MINSDTEHNDANNMVGFLRPILSVDKVTTSTLTSLMASVVSEATAFAYK